MKDEHRMTMRGDVAFVSYARDDAEFALRLASDLRAAGATVWIDQLDIVAGQPWDLAVEKALKASPIMLVILSVASVVSPNVQDEVALALDEKKTVIPILSGDCAIPFRLRRLQYADFRTDYARGLEQLIRALGGERQAAASDGERAGAAASGRPRAKRSFVLAAMLVLAAGIAGLVAVANRASRSTPATEKPAALVLARPPAPAAPAAADATPALPAGVKDCGPGGLIDDGEDGDGRNLPRGERGGYWFTFKDKASTVEPVSAEERGIFAMSAGGHGSRYAARFHGKIGDGAVVFAGMGMNFTDPKALYDASRFAGIAFWARRGDESTDKVRVRVADVNTDPDGGVCTACFNHFGRDLSLSPAWQRYVLPWQNLQQVPGWGAPRPERITAEKLYAVFFDVGARGPYDIWVDDLQFVCHDGAPRR